MDISTMEIVLMKHIGKEVEIYYNYDAGYDCGTLTEVGKGYIVLDRGKKYNISNLANVANIRIKK